MRPAVHLLLAVLCALPGLAGAQTAPTTAPAACTAAADMGPAQLYGLWQLTLWPEGGSETAPVSSGTVLFERHPEYPGSVRGQIRRSAAGNDLLATVSGDVTGGEFNLDESADGVAMSAVWNGEPQDCGRELRGTRRPAEGPPVSEPVYNFRLTKTPGWH